MKLNVLNKFLSQLSIIVITIINATPTLTTASGATISATHIKLARVACLACSTDSDQEAEIAFAAMTLAMSVNMTVRRPRRSGQDLHLLVLNHMIADTKHVADDFVAKVNPSWKASISRDPTTLSRLKTEVDRRLAVSFGSHPSFTEKQKTLLNVLVKTSNFALFLGYLEESPKAYGKQASDLLYLKSRILQVTCSTRQLLWSLNDAQITSFLQQDLPKYHTINFSGIRAGVRRIVVALAVEYMAYVLGTFDLSSL